LVIQTEKATKRRFWHRLTIQQQDAALVRLMKQADDFPPNSPSLEIERLYAGIFAPVGRVELEGGKPTAVFCVTHDKRPPHLPPLETLT